MSETAVSPALPQPSLPLPGELPPDAPIPVAVDDGFSHTKLALRGKTLVVPSAIASGLKLRGTMDGKIDESVWAYRIGALEYSVGDGIEASDLDGRGYHGSEKNVVMVHHALHKAGLAGRKVSLICGVPVKDYYRDGQKNDALIAAKRKAMLQSVERLRVTEDKNSVEIVAVQVVPQAVAAVGALLFDQDGRPKGPVGTVAVVDVGGETVDTCVVEQGRTVDHSKTTSEHLGVLAVKRRLAAKLRTRFQLDERLSWAELDGAFKTGKISLFGQQEDVSREVSESIAQVEADLCDFVERTLGKGGARYAGVLFIGGGSSLFPKLGTLYRHGKIVPSPELANAKGMLAMLVGRQTGKKG